MCVCVCVCEHSDEDDTAELLKELKKIKQERAQEQAAKVSRYCCIPIAYVNSFAGNANYDYIV